ncbi:hypothetical protein DFP73DRAFT_611679 [Morchella snyderi]|nr:hypothetical protein DFP73DRAFT_611679 [Morchella snyderi]
MDGIGKYVLASLVVEKLSVKYSLDNRTESGLPSHAKLRTQLVEISKAYDQVYVVIDAIDECRDQDQHPFIPLIISICLNLGLNIKVFITSTREKCIIESFQTLICPVIRINIEGIRPALDIAGFVSSEVDRRSEGYVYGVIGQKIKESIKASLVNFQLIYLYSQPSLKGIENALYSLPSDMGPTYNYCSKKLEAGIPALSKLEKRALTWVLFAARPLDLEELVHAVTIDQSMKSKSRTILYRYNGNTIIEVCANLVTIEGEVVRPVHYTAQYLTSPTACIEEVSNDALQSYRVLGHNAHAELAQACLQYLLLDEFQKLLRPFTWTNAIPPHPNWFQENRFLEYAVHYGDYRIHNVVEWSESLVHSFKCFLLTESIITFVYKIRIAKCTRLRLGLLKLYERFNKTNVPMEEYTSLMHQATLSGSLNSIEILLDMGLSANSQNHNGIHPLYCACETDDEAVVKLLLERGAEPDARGGLYETALQAASHNGNIVAVKALLEKCAEVNIQGGYYGNSLRAAAFDGDEIVARTLLDKGAEINVQGD